ncbi:MAG: leucine-rich repeat domain-containing protein [Bacteroidaceae bacterium]|nr:leucine-rich repeat domain-containing protein [Bacteroidaceae bacterium]
MKKNVLFLSVIASAAFLAACSSDDLVDDTNNPVVGQEVEHITVTLPDMEIVSFDDAGTRAEFTYKAETDAFAFAWSSGDVLGVFPNKGAQVDFPIDEKFVGTSSAEFDGGGWALKTGYTYAVYYPYDYYNRDKTALPMNYIGQSQKKANDYSHLNAFNYFASNEAITASGPSLDFHVGYMGTIIFMPFTLPDDAVLTEIRLVSSDTPFITQANLDISGLYPTFTPTMESQTVSLKLNNIAVSGGVESNFYMWVLPRDFTGSKLTAEIVTSNGQVYETVLFASGYNFTNYQGKYMRFRRPSSSIPINLKGSETNKAVAAMIDLYNALGKPSALSSWPLAATSEADFDGATGVTVDADGHITEIDLSSMGLTGTIPESIGDLTYLTLLDLSGNNLTSAVVSGAPRTAEEAGSSMAPTLATAIPTTIGNLTKLIELKLGDNLLSGELPSTLGNLKQLKKLWLYNNSLSGDLPLWIGNLTALEELDIADNNFTGDFAKWFFNDLPEIPTLKTLLVQGNKLTGEVTQAMQELARWLNLVIKDIENQQDGDIIIDDGTVAQPKATIEPFTETNYGW